jgi:prepilin-type N-terminal cleavage/methylation domain-containing protein
MPRSLRPAPRRGLTLIELVVVMAILAALAVLVIPRLDFLRGQADQAAAATNAGEVATLLQTQRTSSGTYPMFDVLTDTSGTPYDKVWSTGGSPFTTFTVPAPGGGVSWYRSFINGGITNVLRNDPATTTTAGGASSSGTIVTPVQTTITTSGLPVAELNYLASPGIHPYVSSITKSLYPGHTPGTEHPVTKVNLGTNVKLIAMGLGPNSNFSLGNVPLISVGDDTTQVYCRYIAIFAIYSNGKGAELKMVTDHRMRPIDTVIADFKAAGA